MASAYLQEPWAGASAGTWSEAKYSWRGTFLKEYVDPFNYEFEYGGVKFK